MILLNFWITGLDAIMLCVFCILPVSTATPERMVLMPKMVENKVKKYYGKGKYIAVCVLIVCVLILKKIFV